jgi:hypothetical protein
MNPVSEDIKDMLIDSTLAVGEFAATTGWSIYISQMPDDDRTPDTCIAVLDSGGSAPDPDPEKDIGNPTVQILIRGSRMGYQAAWDKARAIFAGLHGRANETWNDSRYIQIFASSDIISLGYDERQRPLLSLNFAVMRTAST